ncbi:biotin-dependent carboxylase-like uncharacterized protein [Idiomarina fontislapidosi]|uniref:Allophanate hydrolase n=1 Tax=Idiomarina fontislapidosi TaxID=263723 RepID=A0A432Y954_9GAMM|nr:biotin-dependent carboxyltransferase family protein [Idiomarina fontislapidosi]PYE34546.1 biotin-dependent carboxylase-like uncharacterized protein [Idiomarina fontislapidosi]RUO57498.1 allophanate hydrolase [Idiomarina fontislapidosi]
MIEVIEPGMYATIQDFGRLGYLKKGLTRGGPIDENAFLWGNYLLKNNPMAAQIEIVLGGSKFKFTSPAAVAVCGADVSLKLDNNEKSIWETFQVEAGQVLTIGPARNGLRAYLAVAGGIQVDAQWGSCATVKREHLGGHKGDGSALQKGDTLAIASSQCELTQRIPWRYRPDYSKPPVLGLIPGFQYDQFAMAEREKLCFHEYTISQQSDRMGIRLEGPAIEYAGQGLVSEGINIGSVQVPPNGQPIIMMNDRQTLGGYPKLGNISPLDLSRLAQCRPGQTVQFTRVEVAQVQQQLTKYYDFFGITPACQTDH